MRDLSATNIETNQKSPIERPPLLKLLLSKSGDPGSPITYDISSTTNRIIGVSHIEQEWNQVAFISVNSDPTLAALDLQGWRGDISYGYEDATLSEGVWSVTDEYSTCAPLEVSSQKTDTDLTGPQARLTTSFALGGVFNFMSGEKAQKSYRLETDDPRTVKALLTAIAEATLPPFTDSKAYTITFDASIDGTTLVDTYKPADYFYVAFGEDRLSAFRKLLKTTKAKAIIKADGAIHVFLPTISGSSYDYEFNDAVTNHNFYEKGVRERLVLPNKVVVSSGKYHFPQYTGSATDADTFSALGRYLTDYKTIRAVSDAQCTAIATAILQHIQVDSEKGHGFAPMNCGQEVMDYIKITDSVASDNRTGNIGYLHRRYVPGKRFDQEFRFGALPDAMQLAIGVTEGELSGAQAWDYAQALIFELWNEFLSEGIMQKLHVTQRMTLPDGIWNGN